MVEIVTPAEAEIAAAVLRLRSRDAGTLRVVESLARQLPRDRFLWVLGKLEQRMSNGRVRDDSSLLVHLLKIAVAEEARRAVEVTTVDEPGLLGVVEGRKRSDPAGYIEAMRGAPGFDVEGFLAAYVPDEAARERLRRGRGVSIPASVLARGERAFLGVLRGRYPHADFLVRDLGKGAVGPVDADMGGQVGVRPARNLDPVKEAGEDVASLTGGEALPEAKQAASGGKSDDPA
jgi:hypothetical protein